MHGEGKLQGKEVHDEELDGLEGEGVVHGVEEVQDLVWGLMGLGNYYVGGATVTGGRDGNTKRNLSNSWKAP